jgi:hypothetical protein
MKTSIAALLLLAITTLPSRPITHEVRGEYVETVITK